MKDLERKQYNNSITGCASKKKNLPPVCSEVVLGNFITELPVPLMFLARVI